MLTHALVDLRGLAPVGSIGTPNVRVLGALAADIVAEAIVRAVCAATSIPGLPAVRDSTGR